MKIDPSRMSELEQMQGRHEHKIGDTELLLRNTLSQVEWDAFSALNGFDDLDIETASENAKHDLRKIIQISRKALESK